MADMADYALASEEEPQLWRDKSSITCRACGAEGLNWTAHGVRWRLFEPWSGKLHHCPVKPLPADEAYLETPARRSAAELGKLAAMAAAGRVRFPDLHGSAGIRLGLDLEGLLDRLADPVDGPRLARAFKASLNARTHVLVLAFPDTPCLPYARCRHAAALAALARAARAVDLCRQKDGLRLPLDKDDLLARLADDEQGTRIGLHLDLQPNPRTGVAALIVSDFEFRP